MVLTRATLSIAALTLANLFPLVGVVWLGWDAAAIVLLYWTENLVIGGYNVLKMIALKPKRPVEHLGKLFYIPFFCLHYGGFCAVHGFFLVLIIHFGDGSLSRFFDQLFVTVNGPLGLMRMLILVVKNLLVIRLEEIRWPVLLLIISHGISFV